MEEVNSMDGEGALDLWISSTYTLAHQMEKKVERSKIQVLVLLLKPRKRSTVLFSPRTRSIIGTLLTKN